MDFERLFLFVLIIAAAARGLDPSALFITPLFERAHKRQASQTHASVHGALRQAVRLRFRTARAEHRWLRKPLRVLAPR